jgi:hypothetical protein
MAKAMGYFLLYLFFVLAGLAGFFAREEEAMGQVPAASIRGRVTDFSGAVITGASLTVRQRQTGVKRIGTTGTGVGLAIVRKAMERMGGRAWAESAPGRGATFYLEVSR